ncbi:MAG: roadblock/LC7 domain-containing protein [candidate division Zixibacteria bacterium]|nr:roadblock/LC7 domain-containing protein [candidate division Zixibacteria bacterium]
MSKELRMALILLFLLAAVPVIFFPAGFGFDYAGWAGPRLLAAEAAYYFLVFFLVFPEAGMGKTVGFTLGTSAYRLFAGTVLGVLLSVIHSQPLAQAMKEGWYAYFPGFLLMAVLAPFLLKNLWGSSLKRPRPTRATEPVNRSAAPPPAGGSHRTMEPAKVRPEAGASPRHDLREINFDDALAYIGEQRGVRKAYLVDEEGLVLARFESGGAWEDELWAAWGLVLVERNKELASRVDHSDFQSMELSTTAGKVYVQKVLEFYLVAVVEPPADELLNVRLVRAVEMIRRHWQEKYEPVLKTSREGHHVPDLRGA